MSAILIIEDDATLQEAYSFMLETAGHDVASAYNGHEGLELATKKPFDIILLDLHMPVMDGWEFLIKYAPTKPDATKIVVFSNMVEPEIKKRAIELGAHEAILKSSMTPSTMLSMIQSLGG